MSPSPTTTAAPTMKGGPRKNSTRPHASSAGRPAQEKSFHERAGRKVSTAVVSDAARLATADDTRQTPLADSTARRLPVGNGRVRRGAHMRGDLSERLRVEVRLLPDPCLWCWEIRDADRNEVLESSWAGEWTAYRSSEEALRAGRRRLTDRPAA